MPTRLFPGAPRMTRLILVLILACVANARAQDGAPAAPATVDFNSQIRPILVDHCLSCHGSEKQKSQLRLDSRESALTGGASGPALVPGDADQSELIARVQAEDAVERMPPSGPPLDADQIQRLRAWIDQGAVWTEPIAPSASTAARAPLWSLQPIVAASIPSSAAGHDRPARNPIDAFIAERLASTDLSPAPEADRRTLVRRLTINLTGLPPTFTDVEAFVVDPRPDAYERLVDRLLAHPRYGERWARHWLDVAHYADSHGQDQDRPRPNAWPYRDYLIRAFNADVPYAQFVEQQIAGDAVAPLDPDAIVATGFLAAGPWDESSLRDIREDSIDREIGRYLDRDDIVTSTASTFLGLTVGCARCHDHKFDPISQADYYALQAVFAGVGKGERLYDADPAVAHRRIDLQTRLDQLRQHPDAAPESDRSATAALTPARFASDRAARQSEWTTPDPSALAAKQGTVLKALIDRSILALGPTPERDTYTITLELPPGTYSGLRLEVLPDELLPQKGPGRQQNGNLHLSEITLQSTGCDPKAPPTAVVIRRAVADFDQADWGVARAIDGDAATAWGIYPEVGRPHQAVFELSAPLDLHDGGRLIVSLDQNHGAGHLIGRFRLSVSTASLPFTAADFPVPAGVDAIVQTPEADRTPAAQVQLARFLAERAISDELALLPPQSRVYCGGNRFVADGTHRPVERPRAVHRLERGDIHNPREAAQPGTITAIAVLPARFDLANPDDEGARRAALARWVIDPTNPLTWRSIVNRAWHYHFSRGIVDTPNDLGTMGSAPSHPALLDWLAAEFRDSGGSLKALHRQILLSHTYRQSSRPDPSVAVVDADNRLLSHMNRQRLDADSLRDALLQASGRLDSTMFGPPVYLFVMKPGVHVTPVADFDAFDIDRPEAQRRSVYRYLMRTRPDPFLEVFDCPDASQSVPVRGSSVSPLQALALWNDRLVARHSEHLAARVAAPSTEIEEQVDRIAEAILVRRPTDDERPAWRAFVHQHGLANLARVLLNASEFLFVD